MSKPEKNDATEQPAVTLTFEQLKELLESAKSSQVSPEDQAMATAKAHQKLNERDNRNPPKHSVFAHPDGDAKHPRPELECPTFWIGGEMFGGENADVDTYEEIELVNQLQAGQYFVTKGDGTRIKLEVKCERDFMSGKNTKKEIAFDVKGNNRHNHRSKVDYCHEVIAQQQLVTV